MARLQEELDAPDHQRAELRSARTWTLNLGIAVWAAMFCSILIWNIGEVRQGTLGNTGNYYRILLVAFSTVVGPLVLLRNGARLSQAFSGPLALLAIYAVVAMASALYLSEYAFYSMWKSMEVFVDVMAAGAILSYTRAHNVAVTSYRIIVALFALLIILYWIEAILAPSSAFIPSRGILPYTMQGLLPVANGNGLAFMGALVALSSFSVLSGDARTTSKAILWCLFTLAIATLVMAQSRTSLLGFLAALVVYLFFARRYLLLGTLVALSLVGWFSTSVFDIAQEYVVRGQSRELLTSLSGRTQGWEAAWHLFLESPVVGHGFAAAARLEILGTEGASTLHGAVFDVLVGVGILGLLPWLGAITWTSMRLLALSTSTHPWMQNAGARRLQAEVLGVLTLILARSVTSSGLALHEHTFMLFLSVLAYATSLRRVLSTPIANERGRSKNQAYANA